MNEPEKSEKSVILVTGAGTSIGKLSAQALAVAGHIVYATMRDIEGCNKARADALRALAEEKGIQLHPLELDVLSQDSADAAAAAIVREQGGGNDWTIFCMNTEGTVVHARLSPACDDEVLLPIVPHDGSA